MASDFVNIHELATIGSNAEIQIENQKISPYLWCLIAQK